MLFGCRESLRASVTGMQIHALVLLKDVTWRC